MLVFCTLISITQTYDAFKFKHLFANYDTQHVQLCAVLIAVVVIVVVSP